MPLVRIDCPSSIPAEHRAIMGDVVYDAMRATMTVPENDRFQVITAHAATDLIIDPTYLGIERGPDAVLIQVTLSEGRTVEKKKAFYKTVADGLNARVGLRREDVFISLVEVKKENWSFGKGEAQYA